MTFFDRHHSQSSGRSRIMHDIVRLRTPKAKKAAFSSAAIFALLGVFELALFVIQAPHQSSAAATVIVITSAASSTWQVPSDWNNASNTIEVIGGGAGGVSGSGSGGSRTGNGGGGGGAYAKITNFSATPGNAVPIHVGSGGATDASGSSTWLGAATCAAASVCADAGQVGTGTVGGPGGSTAASTGTVTFAGGPGGNGASHGAGGGGGGAAGLNGIGGGGTNPTGGTGDNGTTAADTNGTEWSTTPAYGSGGGGSGVNGAAGNNGGTYGAGGGGGSNAGNAGGTGQPGIIVITYTPPTLTVGATGTQISTTTIPSASFFIGGAFTFVRDSGNATATQITVSEKGTINANANLSNLILFYKQQTICNTSTIPAGATQFNGAPGNFNASDQATVTGSMPVGTSQMCMYVQFDVGANAGSAQTIEIEISNPSTDVTVSLGSVSPATPVAIPGTTTLPTTTLTQQDFRLYANADAVNPTSSLAAENASTTNIASGQVIRIRANVAVGGAPLATSSAAFKLQFAPKGGAAACGSVPNGNFADVGAFASSTPWRGYDNANTADGAAATSTLLVSSTVPESYAEQNPTTSTPRLIPAGGVGEWDFVVQDHAATSGAAYCFRMETSAGALLDGYSHYPELTTYPAATWRAPEDTATSTKKDFTLRLRVEVSNNGNANDSGSFMLEYATSTAGPWSAVPVDAFCATTAAAFRICPSNYFLDLDPTENELTAAASTFISGFMIASTSPAPSIALNTNQFTELEWNLAATDAAIDGQTYYFRATDAGASIGTYSVYPQLTITAASTTFAENYFRWYADADALKPTDPWPPGATDLGENTAITADDAPPKNGDPIRLRMSVQVGNATFATSSQAFKLQYGTRSTTCGAISSWNDVGTLASTTIWKGFNNTSTADGTALSGDPPTAGDLVLSVSDRAGRYTESNPSASNPFKAAIGEDVEYDWSLTDNNATSSATYCFRMARPDGTALDAYTYYPTLTTSGFNPKSQNWRFYDDYADETPTSALAAENTAPSNTQDQSIMKLRVTVKDVNGVSGQNVKFKVQFSDHSDFSQNVNDVAEIGSCSQSSDWCYADGGGADNGIITTKVLSDADACSGGAGTGCGTHNESGISISTSTQSASAATEYEFTIKQSGATVNAVYYFRLVDAGTNAAVPPNTGASYPSVSTGGTNLTFTVEGLPNGTTTASILTTVTTTPAGVAFGSLTFSTSTIGGQRLTVTTNATQGYEVYVYENQRLVDDEGAPFPDVSSTNAFPAAWGIPGSASGAFGYHTTAAVLAGGSTRFAADDTYAKFETSTREIAYSSVPTSSSTVDMVFRIAATDQQPAGSYTNAIAYIVVPVF